MKRSALVECPGFVDLQVNGYLGIDFSDPSLTEKDFIYACDALLQQGTAAFLPTLITCSTDVYEHNLPIISNVIRRKEYRGRLLGIHLEGPFISDKPGAVGAHNPLYVQKPDISRLQTLLELAQGTVKLLTIAAELPGIETLIPYAVDAGLTVSVGHSLFDDHALHTAVQAGAHAITHLGNGLPNLMARHPNPLWTGLACDDVTAMFITDGHHLPDAVIKVAVRSKSVRRTIVVSDASPVAGLPPGNYRFSGNDAILEKSGKFHNPAKQCLVGSSATMLDCMNHMASLNLLTLDELLDVGYWNPLRLIQAENQILNTRTPVIYNQNDGLFQLVSN